MRPSEATLAYGREIVRALLGVDVLYRAESGDGDGLAVLNMDTERVFEPAEYTSYADAEAAWTELSARAAGLPEPDRCTYYGQLAASTSAFLEWRTQGLSFERQVTDFLHVPALPASTTDLDSLRRELRSLLNRMGYHGDLPAQCSAWEERNQVPPDEVEGVVSELMSRAWELTEERVVEIPADESDGMRVCAVSGVAYNARCDYLSRTVDLNVDPTLTLPGLRHLVAHEGYPGHYVQLKLRETWFRDGAAPADVLLSIVNSASSSVFEGIADTGLAMIGWDVSDDDRVQAVMNRYRAGIGTGAAWRLHALGWPEAEVADWLRGESLVGGEGWVRNRMRFIAAPARAALIWSYWWGERTVLPAWRAVSEVDRTSFTRFLYGRMHSNDSVGMFTS